MRKDGLPAEMIAEFLGTLVLILFGSGVCAMVVLFGSGVPGEIVNGGYTNITLGWGLGVTFGIYLAGKISGAHLNPAVTLSLAVFRGFPWVKVLPYSLAQTAGGGITQDDCERHGLARRHLGRQSLVSGGPLPGRECGRGQ